MSGYENKNSSMSLMRQRLRERGRSQDWRYLTPTAAEYSKLSEGVADHLRRITANGGSFQQDRMIFDKRRSLDEALFFSYQGADIIKLNEDGTTEGMPMVRGLINPNKLKPDYDDKVLSAHKEDNFKPGDIFEWVNTNTHWLIYLQDLTELAYFRGDIRRCSYEIAWEDENGRHSTFAAIRGPVETKINFIQKHQISVDNPNHSLHILMPRTEATFKYFQRYSKFYLQDENPLPSNICWRVEAVDWISTPGILEINAVEYYRNETEDDVENGIVGGLIVKPEQVEDPDSLIQGEGFIKPKKEYIYTYTGFKTGGAAWSVDSKLPIQIIPNKENIKEVKIKWMSTHSGQFDLSFGAQKKTIVVESLF